MQAKRIYAIRVKGAAPIFALVKAPNAARALAHHTRAMYEVEVATQEDLVEALTGGIKVQQAGDADTVSPPLPNVTTYFLIQPAIDEMETAEIEDARAEQQGEALTITLTGEGVPQA